jgi:hypothetical protein
MPNNEDRTLFENHKDKVLSEILNREHNQCEIILNEYKIWGLLPKGARYCFKRSR